MKKTLLALLLAALPAQAQPAPVIDNARVTVRDVALEPGQAAPVIRHAGDYVSLYRKGGQIRGLEGMVAVHADGCAVFGHGVQTSDTAVSAPAHEVIVELEGSADECRTQHHFGLPRGLPAPRFDQGVRE